MAHHPAIRILLATLVALWSPAWCCCRVLEAGQASSGHLSSRHDGAVHVASHDTPPSCPGHAEDDRSPCGSDGHPGDKCGCQNHDRQVDVTRSIEPLPLTLAGLLDGFARALPPTIADVDALATKQRLRSEAVTAVGTVRAQTLHAQRCLLLI
jgi:hypothetical protein